MICSQILSSSELGGGELVGINLAHSLSSVGLNSNVFVPQSGEAQIMAESYGLAVVKFPLGLASNSFKLNALCGNIITGLRLSKCHPDIIHFHSPLIFKSINYALQFSRCSATVCHLHSEMGDSELSWAFKNPPNAIIVCAKFLEKQVRNCLPPSNQETQRIEVISNAVDLNLFYPKDNVLAKAELGWDLNIPVILMVADFSRTKGHETIIRAIAILKRKSVLIRCLLVGKARKGAENYETYLRGLVNELMLEKDVIFAGHRSDVQELMRGSDCLVLPSLSEGLPLCILEAQASGLPVIAAPTSGIPELIINGRSGFLVDAMDVEGYAEKISLLLSDAEIRNSIINDALNICREERGWDNYIKKIIELYNDLFKSIKYTDKNMIS